jgi:hypothetical protein
LLPSFKCVSRHSTVINHHQPSVMSCLDNRELAQQPAS